MNAFEQGRPPSLVVRLLTRAREQLVEIARECGHAAFCAHSSHRKKGR
jgi:hypothetical protein